MEISRILLYVDHRSFVRIWRLGKLEPPRNYKDISMNKVIAITLTLILTFAIAITVEAPVLHAQEPASLVDGCKGYLSDDQIVVYYFHRKFRCPSCLTVESTLHETLEKYFTEDFSKGRLAVCVVNIDEKENRHYVKDFQILFNSVIIVDKRGGTAHRYKNIEKIWDIYQDREATAQLIKDEIEPFLIGG